MTTETTKPTSSWERDCSGDCGAKVMVTSETYRGPVLCDECLEGPEEAEEPNEEDSQDERVLTAQAKKIHGLFDKISDALEIFLHNGGQFNLRVYHNEGSESIDLHQLNGEFECSFLQVKELKLDVPGELDDDGNKIA